MNKMEQIGLRLPEEKNASLEQRATEMGISKNALILVLIDLGQKILDGQTVISHQAQQ